MKRTGITIVAIGVFVGVASLHGGEKQTKELMKLEGKWALVAGEAEGKALPEADIKKHTVKVGQTRIVGTHRVDPTGRPKTIDAMDTEGPFKDKTVLGIYEIKGDTFSVCFAPPGKKRPSEFTTKSGTGIIYHIWKRAK
jgi:uncharacterized protein (TIGR03067 family)